MPGTGVHDKYNIAINGRGYILRGSPATPGYVRKVVDSLVPRYSVSDLNYSDLAGTGLFYTAQTDWNAGIKNEKTWRDDGKFYYATNIDAYSEPGTIKLEKEVTIKSAFTSGGASWIDVFCGTVAVVSGSLGTYYGCDQDGSGRPRVFKKSGDSSYTSVVSAGFNTSQNSVVGLIGHSDRLWALTKGNGPTTVVQTYNTSTWTDKSAAISGSVSGAIKSALCGTEMAGALYLALDNTSTKKTYIVSTANAGTSFSLEKEITTTQRIPDMAGYGGKLYYLLHESSISIELRVYDPADSADVSIIKYFNPGALADGLGGKLLRVFKGNLIITLPAGIDRVLSYDGSDITEIYIKDEAKETIGQIADAELDYGSVEKDGRLYWGNLIYDGTYFYNHKRPATDSNSAALVPLFVDENNNITYYDTDDTNGIYRDKVSGGIYKSTLSANFIVHNEMAPVASIDKLLHSATLIFDTMPVSAAVSLYYSTNNMSSWVNVGTVDYANTLDRGITKKEFAISGNIMFNKIWWKTHMNGYNTTPKVHDIIMAYKPVPNYKNQWAMRLNLSDSVKLLNRQSEQFTGQELASRLWNEKNTRQKVLFEDTDYMECTLVSAMTAANTSARVDSTVRFPRQGRIRAVAAGVAEEMHYTSAEKNIVKGISRGQRGTIARAYVSGQVFKNDYDVYIESVRTEVNFIDEKKQEYVAQVALIES